MKLHDLENSSHSCFSFLVIVTFKMSNYDADSFSGSLNMLIFSTVNGLADHFDVERVVRYFFLRFMYRLIS